ncbi:MAG: D-alanyl-D-alanine carboxypeptidase/D-alanyl-D-alanine-endopeptidase [Paludibacteraceae bacterium]|nr:D-alanyl-D-alanine carboxypeptidase/D-alanyl-D-alanine-endopeptidase [Paludibacteraceae bacterium]
MKKTFIISLLAVAASVFGQTALDKFLSNPALQNANVGVCVRNLSTGKVIADSRSAFVIPPASTQKLLTTTTALELLGSDFRFSTYLETDSTIVGGVLLGNLYIRGTGDPTLGSQKIGDQMFLYRWVQALKKKGIREIRGNIIADVSFFDGDAVNPQWIWEDIGNYYAAGVYALPYLDNTLNIQLNSTAVGQVAAVVKTIPQIDGIEFENHIRCTSITYDGAYVHGLPYNNKRYLVGSIPANHGIFGVKGDIPNPPLLLAQHLKMRLEEQGIIVQGNADYLTETLQPVRTLLYEHRSEPLSEILKEINQNSNNLFAEQLFRFLASRISLPCTIQNSVVVLQNCWRNRGINLQNCFIMDGCGLAPQDAVSAGTLVQLLTYMDKSRNKDVFVESLPVAGTSGTLRGFLRETPLQGNVSAKSGTTSRIKSYAGYMTNQEGETLAFAVIVNNASCKSRQVQTMIEKFLLDIYSQP